VHHGGIGTLSQAFAAGIPHVVMPLAHDQQDNAARLERLRVGATLPPKQFRGDRLADILRGLLDSDEVSRACRKYAEKLRQNTALDDTASLLEGLAPAR
jgi:UDP:flavonoid glycosyltransferase YjiC (YdhE family)